MRPFTIAALLVAALPAASLPQTGNYSDLVVTMFAQPCRIVDTRLTGSPLAPTFARGFVVAGDEGFDLQGGTAGGCGIPEAATAALINFVAVSPSGAGNLRASAYPSDPPATGSILNYQALTPGLNIANGLLFPICDRSASGCLFDIKVVANGASTHLVADVLGYGTADHKHSGEDITTGTIDPARLHSSVALESEVLPTVLANDGAGSTLDADFLDGFTSSSFANASHNHDADYERKYAHTVIVRSSGTALQNGTALVDALNQIVLASDTNPYLLKIEPGIFETPLQLLMKPYIDIEGSGMDRTIIRRTGTGAESAVIGAAPATLRHLTVEDLTTDDDAIAFESSFATYVSHVRLKTSGGPLTNYGAFSSSGAPLVLDNVVIEVNSDGGFTRGIRSSGGPNGITIRNTRVTVSGTGSQKRGIDTPDSSTLDNVEVFLTGASDQHVGIAVALGVPVLRNVRITVSGAAVNIGMLGGPAMKAKFLAISVTGGSQAVGIEMGTGSGGSITDSSISVGGASFFNQGISTDDSSFTISDTTISASGTSAYAIVASGGGTVNVDHSSLSGFASVFATGTTVNIGASKLEGPPGGVGPIKCVASYKGDYSAVGTGCT